MKTSHLPQTPQELDAFIARFESDLQDVPTSGLQMGLQFQQMRQAQIERNGVTTPSEQLNHTYTLRKIGAYVSVLMDRNEL
jgi:hypothetical protein